MEKNKANENYIAKMLLAGLKANLGTWTKVAERLGNSSAYWWKMARREQLPWRARRRVFAECGVMPQAKDIFALPPAELGRLIRNRREV